MAVTTVIINKDDAEILSSSFIEYNNNQSRTPITPGTELRVPEGGVFEEFTRHPFNKITASGAFTHVVDCGDIFLNSSFGRYCSIARGSRLMDGHHPLHSVTTNPYHYGGYYKNNLPEELKYKGTVERFPQSYGKFTVGNDVWVGGYSAIKGGVSIGDGAVIASGSVVVKDVPPYAIVGGNPAQFIRSRFPEEIVGRLIDLAWWKYHPKGFRDLNMFDVKYFLSALEKRRDSGYLEFFRPKKFRFLNGKLEVI